MKKYECKDCKEGPCFLTVSFVELHLDCCPVYGDEVDWQEVKEEVKK